ncbi:hypothetical protein B0T16DRAFT_454888 [Cercophora newfieldiana]|uniref:Uncharacterized protein n=1 Tax=Cercophora newfieldiana TaxID=92897 RepID=A0AA39YJ68_9PEZI|nr:hypothetical protein B0T16DRAFT_454888 [Cercophora newfieldiana]
MAEASGIFQSCGDGAFAFSYTCAGPDCAVLRDFPTVICTNSGNNSISCSNGVTCPGASSYISRFTYTQQNDTFSYKRSIQLPECGFNVDIDSDTAEPLVYGDTCGQFEVQSGAAQHVSRLYLSTKIWVVMVLVILFTVFPSMAAATENKGVRPLHGRNTLQGPIGNVYAGIDTKGLEKAVLDYVEDKIKGFAKGDPDALDILIPGSDFIDDIEDTLCMEGLKLAFDQLADMSEAQKKKIELWAKPILKPFTSSCSRKIRRLARKLKVKHPGVRLAAVFGSAFVCEAIKNAFVESVIPGHPSNLEDDIKDAICGGDCGGAELMTDVKNCGACKKECPSGAVCENGVCSSPECDGVGQFNLQGCGNSGCMCARSAGVSETHFCAVADTQCADQLTDDCTTNADCQKGEICGFASGCSMRTCLNVVKCSGSETDSTPVSPQSTTSTPKPLPKTTSTRTSTRTTASTTRATIATPTSSGVVGWVLNVPYAGNAYLNYWINDWFDKKYFLTVNGRATVQTRCVTVAETNEGSFLPGDGSQLPIGSEFDFDSTPDTGSNSCCVEYYSNAQCSEGSGSYGYICGDGSVVLKFAVKSWRVYRCSGWWTGPAVK